MRKAALIDDESHESCEVVFREIDKGPKAFQEVRLLSYKLLGYLGTTAHHYYCTTTHHYYCTTTHHYYCTIRRFMLLV